MTTNTPEPIYYEVLWGIEEHERTVRVDYRDGMAYSEHAEALATRVFLEFVRAGRKVGFFVNGIHKAGHDFAEEEAAWDAQVAAQEEQWRAEEESERAQLAAMEHKTLTGLCSYGSEPRLNWSNMKWSYDRSAWAHCTCGWRVMKDNRELARSAARLHREAMEAAA